MKKIRFKFHSWFKDVDPMIVVGTIQSETDHTYTFLIDKGEGLRVKAWDVDLEELVMMETVITTVRKKSSSVIEVF